MSNVTFQTTALATAPDATIVETEDQGAGVQRQVVKVGNTVAVTGTFFQATQPVSGTFWQATQPVSGTVTAAQATAASLNATVVGTGTFATQAAQSGTWNIGTVTAVTAITNALPAGTALLGKVGIDQTTPGTTNLVATTARNLLEATGTNGYIISAFTLTSGADLASLASGGAVTLSGGGSSGVSSQTNTGSGKYGYVVFQTVTAGFTPTAGGNIAIWWLFSPDGGTTYETTPATPSTTVAALPRPPDCIIPLDAAALGTSAVKVSLKSPMPYGTFKVLVQNNAGAAFGAGNYTMKLVTVADTN